ncbi:MAG: hypothetical protein ACK4UN_08440, partial [Limisphaerales bacterium]
FNAVFWPPTLSQRPFNAVFWPPTLSQHPFNACFGRRHWVNARANAFFGRLNLEKQLVLLAKSRKPAILDTVLRRRL